MIARFPITLPINMNFAFLWVYQNHFSRENVFKPYNDPLDDYQ